MIKLRKKTHKKWIAAGYMDKSNNSPNLIDELGYQDSISNTEQPNIHINMLSEENQIIGGDESQIEYKNFIKEQIVFDDESTINKQEKLVISRYTLDEMDKKEIDYLTSEQFEKDFQKQVEKTTWDVGLPKIYMKDGQIVREYKDGRIEIVKPVQIAEEVLVDEKINLETNPKDDSIIYGMFNNWRKILLASNEVIEPQEMLITKDNTGLNFCFDSLGKELKPTNWIEAANLKRGLVNEYSDNIFNTMKNINKVVMNGPNLERVIMNSLDEQYLNLLRDILKNGHKSSDRTGTGTIKVFGREIRHNIKDGFPILTSKKVSFKNVAIELMWMLKGDTCIKYLVDRGCNIWVGDCYKSYLNYPLATIWDINTNLLYKNLDKGWCKQIGFAMLSPHPTVHLTREEFIEKIKTDDKFAEEWGSIGKGYGYQWRSWTNYQYEYGTIVSNNSIDQIQNLINDLKTNPDSRRLMVNSWNVGELEEMLLVPCHFNFQCFTRKLSLDERCEWRSRKDNVRNTYGQAIATFGGTEVSKWLDESNVPTRAISLKWSQRSVDTALGLPYNCSFYSLLLTLLAQEVNMIPEEIIGSLGDTHIYLNQLDGVKEQLEAETYELPKLSIKAKKSIFDYQPEDFELIDYKHSKAIKYPLSN